MAAINLHYPKMKVFQLSSTQVASGAKIYTYAAGTSTDKATYSDQALTSANANPVIADSNGEAQVWLLDDGLYKIVINDSDDVLISNVDNVGSDSTSGRTSPFNNMCPNGDFEKNTGNDGVPSDWVLSITSGATIDIDTSDQLQGLSSLQFVDGGSGAGTATSGFFEVQASKVLIATFGIKASATTTNNDVEIFWYTSAKVAAATPSTSLYSVTTTAPTSWTEQAFNVTPGSDAKYAKIKITGSGSSGTTRYDRVYVGYTPIPATQAEVTAGTNTGSYITPATLAGTAGTWTPTIDDDSHTTESQTYTVQIGTYTRIGDRVFFSGKIVLTSLGSVSGDTYIGGLPYTASSTVGTDGTCTVGYLNISGPPSSSTVSGTVAPSTAYIAVWSQDINGSPAALTTSEFSASGEITFCGQYVV